jgi:hypothetical protein
MCRGEHAETTAAGMRARRVADPCMPRAGHHNRTQPLPRPESRVNLFPADGACRVHRRGEVKFAATPSGSRVGKGATNDQLAARACRPCLPQMTHSLQGMARKGHKCKAPPFCAANAASARVRLMRGAEGAPASRQALGIALPVSRV